MLPGRHGMLGLANPAQKAYVSNMSTAAAESFAEVWERTIQSGKADLPPDAARYFLKLRFAEADLDRMNSLAAKGRNGTLAREEETELENYMQLGWFIDLVKSKARLSLGLPAGNA